MFVLKKTILLNSVTYLFFLKNRLDWLDIKPSIQARIEKKNEITAAKIAEQEKAEQKEKEAIEQAQIEAYEAKRAQLLKSFNC